jgi:nicotinate phosphoribosyltransferase
MINSLLDNDLYKFTMQNAVIKHFPRVKVRYQFINRGKTTFPEGFAQELRKSVQNLSKLALTAEEKRWLASRCYYLDPTYIDFLESYRFNPDEVGIIQQGGDLQVSAEGFWYHTILWEVPLMALISELYYKMTKPEIFSENKIIEIAQKKMSGYKMLGVNVADFGTRRRYSFENQERIVRTLKNYGGSNFSGSSNVYLAMKYEFSPIGTHAHEWFMFHAAQYGYKSANKTAMENWVKTYRGDLGIALSDTFTTDVFFRAFDTKFAKLFDGVRQDSGDALAFADKTIAHYQKLRIDPMSKIIVFSDGLEPETVEKIAKYCRNRIKISFGIGTNFTNDVGVNPLNIVIKLSEAKPEGQEWMQTVKLSDSPGKYTGNANEVNLCKTVLGIEN